MNAYELANELQDLHGLYCEDAANMLRQQADRIAELSKNVDELKEELLKAPQIKELSDEEIWEVINRTAWVGTEEEIRFKIAEAILKKASEK